MKNEIQGTEDRRSGARFQRRSGDLQGLLDSIRSFKKLGPKASRYWSEPLEVMIRRWQKVRSPDLPLAIRPYDPAWSGLFERERQRVEAVLGDTAVDIQHIGSTSIPGLDSKNIIDIFVALDGPPSAPEPIESLARCGYEDYGNSPIDPETIWLWRLEGEDLAFVVHLCHHLRPWLVTAVNFRDYLRAHPEESARYVEAKRQAARQKDPGILKYSLDKLLVWTDIADRANAWRAGSSRQVEERP